MTTKELCAHHMNLSSTFLEMALRYINIDPQIHELYYQKHLEHSSIVEKMKMAQVASIK